MSSSHRWRIHIRNLETRIAIGLHEHEKKPQRVIVNVTVEGQYPVYPQSIGDCFNYDYLRRRIAEEWPLRPHIHLLETCVSELLRDIFAIDSRVVRAKASVCKPDIFPDVESVGVEAEWTREDFELFVAG